MNKRHFVITAMVLLVLFAAAMFSAVGRVWAGEKKYNGTGYSIVFPDGWDVKREKLPVDMIAISPKDGPEDKINEHISILSGEAPQGVALDKFVDASLEHAKSNLKDFKFIGRDKAKVSGSPAVRLRYTHQGPASKASVIQFYCFRGKKSYIISCIAADKTMPRFQQVFGKIVQSIKFK